MRARRSRIKDLDQTLTLVDGTLLSALPEIVQASWLKETTGSGLVKWRLHTHFEVDRYVPTRMDVTPNGGGDELAVFLRTLHGDLLELHRVSRWREGDGAEAAQRDWQRRQLPASALEGDCG
ncbi:MAG: hypothetical protein ISR77_30660 [Pirellulaceae bacterium]|nr:hypothetical protein [Pirellulaceae bacterium]